MNLKTSLKLDAIKRYQERNHLRQGSIKVKNDTTLQVTTTLSEGTHQMSGNTGEKLAFGLTLEEKSSIEADINAKKPIGDTPAYKKFLKAVFPNKTLSFPYLANYDDAVIVVSKLSKLFGKSVRLPYEDEAIESLKVNNHLTGFRNSCDDRIVNVDDEGDAWLSGETQDTCAPCASLDCDGISRLDTSLLRNGHSVIPIFG